MVERPVDASALAFLEEAEEKALEVEYLELTRTATSYDSVERRSFGRGTCSDRRVVGGRKKKRRRRLPRSPRPRLVSVCCLRSTRLVPVFYALLGLTVDTCSCLDPGGFLGRIPHYFYVKVALARSALGNLDFPRTPSIWHTPVWCFSSLRSTGKLEFLGADSRISTSLCI